MIRHLPMLAGLALAQTNDIINVGIPWYDTNDKLLQAHGGSVTEVDGTFYLIGENKTTSEDNPRGNYFNSVAVSVIFWWHFLQCTANHAHSAIAPLI
jgi:hypothetical protein